VKRLIGRPQESTQSERKSTPRFEKGLNFLICHIDFIDIIVFQQHEKIHVKVDFLYARNTQVRLTDKFLIKSEELNLTAACADLHGFF